MDTKRIRSEGDCHAGETLPEIALRRLTADIVGGRLAPGEKLPLADLKTRYGMAAAPLREALGRLSGLGFVVCDDRRGFRVAPVSQSDLEDIVLARQVLETAALRRAIRLAGDDWEVGIVAAYARLQRVVACCAEDCEVAEVETAHKQFHSALIADCRSPRLLEFSHVLQDQASRYRLAIPGQARDIDDFLKHHERLASAALSRNADAACAMLSDHVAITLRTVYSEAAASAAGNRSRTAGGKRVRRTSEPQ
jgi:DNA-binding GntR family transcriptional regulator